MTTLEIILIIAVVALAAALFGAEAPRRGRRRDRRIVRSREATVADQRQRVTEATARAERSEAEKHHARADTTEALARERAARERTQAELHEARLQVAALEQSRDLQEQEAGET